MLILTESYIAFLEKRGLKDMTMIKSIPFDIKPFLSNLKSKTLIEAQKFGFANNPEFIEEEIDPLDKLMGSTSLKSLKAVYELEDGNKINAIVLETDSMVKMYIHSVKPLLDMGNNNLAEIYFEQVSPTSTSYGTSTYDDDFPAELVSFLTHEIDSGL